MKKALNAGNPNILEDLKMFWYEAKQGIQVFMAIRKYIDRKDRLGKLSHVEVN